VKGLPQPWLESADAVEREALAQSQLDMALALGQSDAWQQIASALVAQIAATMNDLARSPKDDEQNRGVIRALNHVLSMPDNLIQAASAELDQHR
jgi:hypothetical protein